MGLGGLHDFSDSPSPLGTILVFELVGTRGLGIGLDNLKSISFSYGNILLPRTSLQSTLKQTWMFQCQCPRCSDPSELGLHYSMINKVS